MKMSILSAGLANPHAGWVAIDELAELLAHYFGAEQLSAKALQPGLIRRISGRVKPRFDEIVSAGGDVLFVVARGPEDLALVNAIPNARRKFGKIFAFVTDSYFRPGFVPETALYDGITVTAHEDVDYPKQQFGIPVHQLYQGIDALRWAPRLSHSRDIDILAFGRTPQSVHSAFAKHFHDPRSPHLYLHSPLGSLTGPSVHLERGMLFKILHRTKVSLAYHLLVEPEGARPRSMMVTSRWLESLVAGCIVAGRRPVSRMADEMLSADATIELPTDPAMAVEALCDLLSSEQSLVGQRARNIADTIARHDWRLRIAQLCNLFGLETPAALKADLNSVQSLSTHWEQSLE